MCGIAGHWSSGGELADNVTRMADAIRHRGPDSSGIWTDEGAGVALGHRRLSILDLSPLGHQPMVSPSGRFVVVFNGEIYNFRELRQELRGFSFQGHSDTEVLLAAIEAWGLKGAVQRFVGMFAFALWDRAERELHLVRDRLGIKPVYYGWAGGNMLFASELRSFHAHSAFRGNIDRNSLTLLLRHNCIPAPHSIYEGVYKLLPGHILSVRSPADRDAAAVPFWSAREVAERGAASPFTGTEEEAEEQLDTILRDAVKLRMIADVPLGAFLSGGIDSSTVVALMQAQSDRPVKTFSIGSHDAVFDEAQHASAVARHLGTDHTELYVTAADALTVVPELPTMFDEPFADSSQIPTYLVSRLARQHVTVSLSGDGGDELFAGSNRHVWGKRIWGVSSRVPNPALRALGSAIRATSPEAWDRVLQGAFRVLPRGLTFRMPGYKLHKMAGLISATSPDDLYRRFVSHWNDPGAVVLRSREPRTLLADPAWRAELGDLSEQIMYLDTVTYLPDDILTKVDRASMAVALEARVPLLDHRVVEFAWRLPLSMKIRDGRSKWILRQVLHRYVPRALVDRPKTGFGVPLATWLRGPLREWAEELLEEGRLRREGFFDPAPIRRKWKEHLAGKHSWEYDLWDVLTFQAWLEAHGTGGGLPAGIRAAAEHRGALAT